MGERLTLGYRARIKPDSHWESDDYANREVILIERSSGSNFAALVLKEGVNVPLDRAAGTVDDSIAWLHESELEFVDDDIEANVGFTDWYQEVEDNFCPDCGHLCSDEDKIENEDELRCPKCDCEWR